MEQRINEENVQITGSHSQQAEFLWGQLMKDYAEKLSEMEIDEMRFGANCVNLCVEVAFWYVYEGKTL